MSRERVENNFRDVLSKDGTYSTHIGKKTAERTKRYCRLKNMNVTKFVEKCINDALDVLEEEYLQEKTQQELIEIIKKGIWL